MKRIVTDGVTTYKGLCLDMLKEMAAKMNFRCMYHPTAE